MSINLRFLAAVCFSLALATSPMVSSLSFAGGKGTTNEVRIEGNLISISPSGQIVIRVSAMRTVTVQLLATTKVERNGVPVRITAFKVGDRVQARLINNALVKFEGRGL